MNDFREEAISIFLKTAERLEPAAAIRKRISIEADSLFIDEKPVCLTDFREIKLIGIGKASITMGRVIEEMLGSRLASGILVTNSSPRCKVNSEVIVSGHPLPNHNSLIAGKRIIETLQDVNSESLIIFLISGGGSALVESPLFDEITLEDFKNLNRILVTCGASIQEINVIRKHLSGIKGGRLGFICKNSMSISLCISDVNSGDIRSIASNPLLPDDATLEDFSRIIAKYNLSEKLPSVISSLIGRGEIAALPNWDESENVQHFNLVLLENSDAINVAANMAQELGYEVRINSNYVEGDYREIADKLTLELAELRNSCKKKACVISGGEAACAVSGKGVGGRNQEFALYTALQMAASGLKDAVVLACGTDGIDGNSIATGAVLSTNEIISAQQRNLDLNGYFQTSDSHSFFLEHGGLVVTGPTGNNIRDLRVFIAP